jgi:hypothetical protein
VETFENGRSNLILSVGISFCLLIIQNLNILQLLWTFYLLYLIALNGVLLSKGNEISVFARVAMKLSVKKDPAPSSKLIMGRETKAIELINTVTVSFFEYDSWHSCQQGSSL